MEYQAEIIGNPPQPLDASFEIWLNYTIIVFICAPLIILSICVLIRFQ